MMLDFYIVIRYITSMITIILVVIIAIILILFWIKSRDVPKKSEQLINMNDIPTRTHRKSKHTVEPNFIEAKFHADYMDVSTSFNNLSPNQRQIFNINNVPCKVTKDVDIQELDEIIKEFISSLNDDIRKNVPMVHTASSGWDEVLPEHVGESGWEKVQRQLGLPVSLYNKPKMNTKVKLVQFSNVIKYETENEIKYVCHIVISKHKVADNLVVKISFVLPKKLENNGNNVILENIDIIGYMTEQGLGTDRNEMDDFYYFDSLEKNNMITGKTVATEMMKKYEMREKVMQERIDGMDSETQEKYRTSPSPAEYDTYKMTQTVIDDMFGEKLFV